MYLCRRLSSLVHLAVVSEAYENQVLTPLNLYLLRVNNTRTCIGLCTCNTAMSARGDNSGEEETETDERAAAKMLTNSP